MESVAPATQSLRQKDRSLSLAEDIFKASLSNWDSVWSVLKRAVGMYLNSTELAWHVQELRLRPSSSGGVGECGEDRY